MVAKTRAQAYDCVFALTMFYLNNSPLKAKRVWFDTKCFPLLVNSPGKFKG